MRNHLNTKSLFVLMGASLVASTTLFPLSATALDANDRFAVVNADGTLARKSAGNVLVTHTADSGSYIVRFNKHIRDCAYTATIGLSGASGTSARGFITVVAGASDPRRVFVTTDDVDGAPAERGFHLLVTCP